MWVLSYGCTTWTLMKHPEKRLDGNYTRMLCAVLNNSWKQHTTKPQLYSHLPTISQIIQGRWMRYAGHSYKSKHKLIKDILLWTLTLICTSVGWPAKTLIHYCPVGWGCRIHRLLLCRGVRPPQWVSWLWH